MKTIELTVARDFDERAMLIEVVHNAPLSDQGRPLGYSIGEMGAALKVLDKLNAMGGPGTLELEDAEHAFVADRLAKQRWLRADAEIAAFVTKVVAG